MKQSIPITLFVFALWFAVGCTNLPRDPKETLSQLHSRPLRVGLVEHPPWVVRTSGEPAGVEADLLRNFASELGTTLEWTWGGEQRQLEALEHYQLDVVIGGLTDRTPWSKYVGLTSTYFEETFRIGVPASSPVKELKGSEIAIRKGEAIASKLEKEGARVVRVDDLAQVNGLVAAPDWELEQLSLNITGEELDSLKHVIAVPPGENAFVKRLDEFLYTKRFEIRNLLQQQVAKK